MLSTLLVMVPWLPITALVAFAAVGPLVGALLVPRRRATAVLLGVAVVAVVGLTLTPDGTRPGGITCAVDLPYLSWNSVESLANILLLAPVALLAGVLLRRPIVAAGGAVALSGLIEGVQALSPGIGRACDTSDLITNAMGAVLGGLLAAIALRLAARRWIRRKAGAAQEGA